jgi:hypothetical protein
MTQSFQDGSGRGNPFIVGPTRVLQIVVCSLVVGVPSLPGFWF